MIPYKKLLILALFAFLFNLAWEVSHSPLYKTITDMTSQEYVPRILQASGGDIIMILLIFLSISLANRSLKWKLSKKNIFLSVIFGMVIAIAFELYAKFTHRFEYNSNMPLIPLLKVGLTPVLQMIITPLLTFFFTERITPTNR